MKKIIAILILGTLILFISSCGINAKKKVNELGNLYENNKNEFVFTSGITKDNKTYWFKDLISKEVKKNGKILRNERFYSDQCYLYGDFYYFVFKYFSRFKKGENSIEKYVSGYIDINNFKVKLFKFYEDGGAVNIFRFGDMIAFIGNDEASIYDGDENIKTFDLDGYEGTNNLYSKQLILCKTNIENTHYWILNNDLTERKFTIEQNTYLYYVDNDYLITSKNNKHFGIYLENNKDIEPLKLEELVKNRRYVYDVDTYMGKPFISNILDDFEDNYVKNGYIEIKSGEFNRLIKLTEIRELVPEVKKTEEIFNTEISFHEVICVNDKVYISLVNNETFFGFYSGRSCPPIVLKYNIENDSFEYMGYYGNSFGKLLKIIEG